MAEAHPVGFRWVMKAKERGARIIHVDPRYSRTSQLADQHVPIRAGSDIAFLGGLIHHVLETESYFRDYVVNYTNALDDHQRALRGRRGPRRRVLRLRSRDGDVRPVDVDVRGRRDGLGGRACASTRRQAFAEKTGAGMLVGEVQRDDTLQDPRCVFQILRRHFSRYTPEMVERICGISQEDFRAVAEALVENSGRERTTAFCYAVGWTQHSAGVQMIRTAAILQLLLGNIGRPGGGILALRGHASIQGSTDIPTLYDLLPGYLHDAARRRGGARPRALHRDRRRRPRLVVVLRYLHRVAAQGLVRGRGDRGERVRLLGHPRISGNHSHFATMMRMLDGGVEGFFVMGQNPAVGSQHAGLQRRALARLKWLVVRDMAEIETATFWRDSPEVQSGELRPEDIQTEVFLMPAAAHVEKEGCFTNTQRLVQFRDKALEPPGDARSELWFMHHLAKRVKAHYAGSTRKRDWPIVNLRWDYPELGDIREPDVEAVMKEINGYDVATGRPVSTFSELRSDGSTACGCWIYSGIFADGVNQARRREPGDLDKEGGHVSPEWAWAWPANRRKLYNRASADPAGRPWSERKKYVWWDAAEGRWTGYDVPDFPPDKAPDYRAAEGRQGHGRDRRGRPVHDDGRRTRLAVLAQRPARRAAADALRAARVAGAKPPVPGAGRQSVGHPLASSREPAACDGRPALPDRGHDASGSPSSTPRAA